MVIDGAGAGAGQDMRNPGNPLSAVLIRSSFLFGHNVLLGRYFNADSNKPSDQKIRQCQMPQGKTVTILSPF